MFGAESNKHLNNRKQANGADAGVAGSGKLMRGCREVLSEEPTPSETRMMRTQP